MNENSIPIESRANTVQKTPFSPSCERLFHPEQIAAIVAEVSRAFVRLPIPRPSVLCPVLMGAMVFASDLIRDLYHYGIDMEIRPIMVHRRNGDNGTIHYPVSNYPEGIRDRDIMLVDTIMDSGSTIAILTDLARSRWFVKSVSAAVLLNRCPTTPAGLKHFLVGRELKDDRFLWGYGLDREQHCRGVAAIYASAAMPESELALQAGGQGKSKPG